MQGVLDPSHPLADGVLLERCGIGCVPFMEGQNELTHSPEMLEVFEGAGIQRVFRGLLDSEEVRSFDFKWLRAMPKESFTGAHFDRVYMGRGTIDRLLTCWIPFGDNPVEMGTVAVCEGSHKLESFAPLRCTYGLLDHERDGLDGSGWFTQDPWEVCRLFGGGDSGIRTRALLDLPLRHPVDPSLLLLLIYVRAVENRGFPAGRLTHLLHAHAPHVHYEHDKPCSHLCGREVAAGRRASRPALCGRRQHIPKGDGQGWCLDEKCGERRCGQNRCLIGKRHGRFREGGNDEGDNGAAAGRLGLPSGRALACRPLLEPEMNHGGDAKLHPQPEK